MPSITGRLTYDQPNLQDLPVRDATLADAVRAAFLREFPKEERETVDYAELEVRILEAYLEMAS